MKTQYKHIELNSHRNNTQTANKNRSDQELERVAEELECLAKKILPDHAMQDRYHGMEPDMRQDAILLALQWYLREQTQNRSVNKQTTWNAAKSIGAALQIMRRDYAKAQIRDSKIQQELPAEYAHRTSHHPSMDKSSDWTSVQREQMLRQAIRKLLEAGQITQANAAVALGLLVDGLRATDMAKRLGVHRSAICHHFFRVRRLLPDVLEGIEVPRSEVIQ